MCKIDLQHLLENLNKAVTAEVRKLADMPQSSTHIKVPWNNGSRYRKTAILNVVQHFSKLADVIHKQIPPWGVVRMTSNLVRVN